MNMKKMLRIGTISIALVAASGLMPHAIFNNLLYAKGSPCSISVAGLMAIRTHFINMDAPTIADQVQNMIDAANAWFVAPGETKTLGIRADVGWNMPDKNGNMTNGVGFVNNTTGSLIPSVSLLPEAPLPFQIDLNTYYSGWIESSPSVSGLTTDGDEAAEKTADDETVNVVIGGKPYEVIEHSDAQLGNDVNDNHIIIAGKSFSVCLLPEDCEAASVGNPANDVNENTDSNLPGNDGGEAGPSEP